MLSPWKPLSLFDAVVSHLCDSVTPSHSPIFSLLTDSFLPTRIVDRILVHLAETKQTTPDMVALLLSSCASGVTTLPLCGSDVTLGDLKTRGINSLHAGLVELDFTYCEKIANGIDDFVEYLQPCVDTLRTLKIAGLRLSEIDYDRLFRTCTNLQHLDVSFTPLGNTHVELVCNKMPGLQYLDISGTQATLLPSLVSIRQLTRLRYLGLSTLRIDKELQDRARDISVICFSALTQLIHLDFSQEVVSDEGRTDDVGEAVRVEVFEGIVSSAKSLTHLDVSFTCLTFPLPLLMKRLKSHGLYNRLTFLGVIDPIYFDRADREIVAQMFNDLPVALCTRPSHSSMIYPELSRRSFSFLLKVLILYRRFTRGVHPDALALTESLSLIILVLQVATKENRLAELLSDDIVLYASAAFVSSKATPRYLAVKVINLLLTMHHFQRGSAEFITRLLLQAPFMAIQSRLMTRRSLLAYLNFLLDILDSYEVDDEPYPFGKSTWDAVQMLNLLILNLSDTQKIFLVKSSRLFDLVFKKLDDFSTKNIFGPMVEQFLSALWNICDGLSDLCALLVARSDALLRFAFQFSDRSEALMCVIGALSNAAEFAEFRPSLRVPDTVRLVEKALSVGDRAGMVQFTASRLLCMLCLDESWDPRRCEGNDEGIPSRKEILGVMVNMLQAASLKPNPNHSISFKSLEPLIDLARCRHTVEIRLFGVWRIASLANARPELYCPMLKKEGGIEVVFGVEVPDEMKRDFEVALDVLKKRCDEYAHQAGIVENDHHFHAPLQLFILHEQELLRYFKSEHHYLHHHDNDDDEDDDDEDTGSSNDEC